MMNVLNDVQQLEKDLMRDLTNEEILKVINKGRERFLEEDVEITRKELQTLRKVREIISAFCSRDQAVYDKVIEGDVRDAYLLLKRIVGDLGYELSPNAPCCYSCGVTDKGPECEVKSEEKECSRKDFKVSEIKGCSGEQAGGDYDLDKAVYAEDTNYGWIALIMCSLFDMLPAKDNVWLKEFIKLDPDYTGLVAMVTERVKGKDQNEIDMDELCEEISDYMREEVTTTIANDLLEHKGKTIVLDSEILDEVFDYLLSTEKNIKVRAVNNLITVL